MAMRTSLLLTTRRQTWSRVIAARAFSDVATQQAQQSGSAVQPAWLTNSAATSGQGGSGSSLAQLQDQAGFLPRPEEFDERLKPGFRGAKALFIFFLCNALPLGAVLWYLREQRAARSDLSLGAMPADASGVAAEVLRVIRTSNICFLMNEESGAPAGSNVLRVDPHAPEGSAYVPPTEPLPLAPNMERNDLTDIFESPPVPGLGFVHFAIPKKSPFGKAIMSGRRQASLLYVSSTRGAYCSIAGQISVLSDPQSLRHYWKSNWAACFQPPSAPAASSTAPVPSSKAPATQTPSLGEAPATGQKSAEANVPAGPPAWQSADYLLVRLAISDATLRPTIDGPSRWDARRILRRSDSSSAGTGQWTLAPAAA
mmetsp:Transcript_79779/g.165784  ORF Transcript_79779/g.165784 Transcript_79779/m.165784 type:complete len:370 (+) Transcript_79779:117-1226(+)|eukprot:CAMPEP_0206561168 /NCGR_PEP_ID=MMETSP0325_2-20121206/21455_1 /ASSEMBLY_ACC=CAM_ASM_000347 /TAXON_ID=2866 /ORGANISM="Crypthecodinium cohnii, Strain Seligo" /LENGTH=369 /DNA_ID=CAMNT_0054063061 /DNA_START=112 /DNA_END=1221 /DNA_ORIENTATION=+